MELWSTWSGLAAAGRDLLTGVPGSLSLQPLNCSIRYIQVFFSSSPSCSIPSPLGQGRVKEKLGCDVQVQGLDEELFGTEATLV